MSETAQNSQLISFYWFFLSDSSWQYYLFLFIVRLHLSYKYIIFLKSSRGIELRSSYIYLYFTIALK